MLHQQVNTSNRPIRAPQNSAVGFRARFERRDFAIWAGAVDDVCTDAVGDFGQDDPTEIFDVGFLGSGERLPYGEGYVGPVEVFEVSSD